MGKNKELHLRLGDLNNHFLYCLHPEINNSTIHSYKPVEALITAIKDYYLKYSPATVDELSHTNPSIATKYNKESLSAILMRTPDNLPLIWYETEDILKESPDGSEICFTDMFCKILNDAYYQLNRLYISGFNFHTGGASER